VRGNCTFGGNVVSNEWHGDLNAALIALVRKGKEDKKKKKKRRRRRRKRKRS
jgi:hypothetical protein